MDATKYRAGSQRSLELLAILGLMTDFRPKGSMMIQDPEYSRRLAQNLVELLSPYEEELIQLERDAPAFGPLRRARSLPGRPVYLGAWPVSPRSRWRWSPAWSGR